MSTNPNLPVVNPGPHSQRKIQQNQQSQQQYQYTNGLDYKAFGFTPADQYIPKNNVDGKKFTDQKAKYYQEYCQFFQDVQQDVRNSSISNISNQCLKKHRIKFLTQSRGRLWKKLIQQGVSYVQLATSLHSGLQCVYNVVIGEFFLTVNVLHLHRNSQDQGNFDQCLGQGSFAIVRRLNADNKQIAIKKILFPKKQNSYININNVTNSKDFANCYEIKRAISQYCLYKICSMLKIGPQIIFENTYDLVCYNDCVQFQMQVCHQVSNPPFAVYSSQIKKCLANLHFLHIIHKDIKKSNTLFSPSFNSYVLSDFGLSHSVRQCFWQQTQTYFAGTPSNASPDMRVLLAREGPGFVNLYMNDVYGMKIMLDELGAKRGFETFSRNPMSEERNQFQDQEQYYQQSQYCQQVQKYNQSSHNSSLKIQLSQRSLSSSSQTSCQLSPQKLNFYLSKSLFAYLSQYQSQSQPPTINQLKTFLLPILPPSSEPFSQLFSLTLLKYFCCIIKSLHNPTQLMIMQIRNSIRIFGFGSVEVADLLREVLQKKDRKMQFMFSNIQNYLKIASWKNCTNKVIVKKFNNHILNMNRHFCLRNSRSLANSLKALIKNYLVNRMEKQKQRQKQKQKNVENMKILQMEKQKEKVQIYKIILETINFEGLTESQRVQLIKMLYIVCQQDKKKIKNKQKQYIQITIYNYQKYCIKLVNEIYQQLCKRSLNQTSIYQNLAKLHIKLKQLPIAHNYINKVKSSLQQLESMLASSISSESSSSFQPPLKLQTQIIKHNLILTQFHILLTPSSPSTLQSSLHTLNLFNSFGLKQESLLINILDNIIVCYLSQSQLSFAQSYLSQYDYLIQTDCFPKMYTIQLALSSLYHAQILIKNSLFSQSLPYLQKVLECTNDALRGPNSIPMIKKTFLYMSQVAVEMGQMEKGLGFLEKGLEIVRTYEAGEEEEIIQFLYQILGVAGRMVGERIGGKREDTNQNLGLELGELKEKYYLYIKELARLKHYLVNKYQNIFSAQRRKMRIYPIQKHISKLSSLNKKSVQYLVILTKKISVEIARPYLPTFSNQYIQYCQQLGSFYSCPSLSPSFMPTQMHQLRFLWQSLTQIHISMRGQTYYKRVLLCANKLQQLKSKRRAFFLLRDVVFYVTHQNRQYREEIYYQLRKYSRYFERKDQGLWEAIHKWKMFQSLEDMTLGLEKFKEEFKNKNKNLFKIYEKIIKKLEVNFSGFGQKIGENPQNYLNKNKNLCQTQAQKQALLCQQFQQGSDAINSQQKYEVYTISKQPQFYEIKESQTNLQQNQNKQAQSESKNVSRFSKIEISDQNQITFEQLLRRNKNLKSFFTSSSKVKKTAFDYQILYQKYLLQKQAEAEILQQKQKIKKQNLLLQQKQKQNPSQMENVSQQTFLTRISNNTQSKHANQKQNDCQSGSMETQTEGKMTWQRQQEIKSNMDQSKSMENSEIKFFLQRP